MKQHWYMFTLMGDDASRVHLRKFYYGLNSQNVLPSDISEVEKRVMSKRQSYERTISYRVASFSYMGYMTNEEFNQ